MTVYVRRASSVHVVGLGQGQVPCRLARPFFRSTLARIDTFQRSPNNSTQELGLILRAQFFGGKERIEIVHQTNYVQHSVTATQKGEGRHHVKEPRVAKTLSCLVLFL